MNRIDAGVLSTAYDEYGPSDAPAVLLLHGWPDDPSTWRGVGAELARAGLRAIAPAWRGVGQTRFCEAGAPRTGNSAVLALDVIALMDALGIERFAVAGHDWGSAVTEALAVGWPERVTRIAMLSSPPRLGGLRTPPFWHAQLQWYHWFMATKRGAEAVRADPTGFARIMWENWSPPGWFEESTFAEVAASFANSDWVDVTLHSYRSRWGEAEPDPASAWLQEKVASTKTLSLPALYIAGDADGVNPPPTADTVEDKLTGDLVIVRLAGVGHFPQREAPEEVAAVLAKFFRGAPASGAPLT